MARSLLEATNSISITPTEHLASWIPTQGEIWHLRFRLHNVYLTETWISANGNSSSRCGKHVDTLRLRNCGSAETHSLNSRIRYVYMVTETLITVLFPQIENSTDKQVSAGFPNWANLTKIHNREQFLRDCTSLTGTFGTWGTFLKAPGYCCFVCH